MAELRFELKQVSSRYCLLSHKTKELITDGLGFGDIFENKQNKKQYGRRQSWFLVLCDCSGFMVYFPSLIIHLTLPCLYMWGHFNM